MSFSINTNLASLQAQNYLQKSSQFQAQTINEVTSGLRIVNSGDDAAGLAIANGFRSDEAVLNQGIQNANNGLATLQTIDGGMNNISTLLDRARTLATESASGTFSGNRGTLNQEFQSVIQEVSRQAQAIGMNQGGQFAQALNVFIGGGKGVTSAAATNNGTIGMDLSKSAVDAQSLGLQGVQAEGSASVDLSAASATSVQNLVADATNKASEAAAGYTSFSFKGPGFSDGNAIGISVNLSGVTDTQTLATAINSAIQSAGNGATASATAFKNANITASVVSDSSGAQHLAFSSSNAAFQVQAGDKTANALLGNISSGTTGAALQTTFAGGANLANTATTLATQNTTIKLQVQGAGMTSPETISVGVTAGQTLATVLSNVTSAVSSDANLAKAGISVLSDSTHSVTGHALTFQSTSGQQFSVTTGGDAENLLGMGTAQLGSASSSVQYGTTTASTTYNAATATNTKGTANFEFSFNGQASSANAIAVNLSGGDATAGVNTGTNANTTVDTSVSKNLSLKIDGTTYNLVLGTDVAGASGQAATKTAIASDITQQLAGAGSTATASVDNSNHIVITSGTKGAGSSVQILAAASNDASSVLGLSGAGTQGVSQSGTSIANYLNQNIAANSTLAAAGLQASYDSVAHKLTVTSSNNTNFQLNAFGSSSTAAVTGTQTGTGATAAFTASGALTVTAANSNLTVNVDGTAYQVALTAGAPSTMGQIATDINNAVGSSVASANGGTLTLASLTSGSSSAVSIGAGTSADGSTLIGLNAATNTGSVGVAATVTGTATGPVEVTGANHQLQVLIDSTNFTVNLTEGSRTMAQIAADINTAIGAAGTAAVNGAGHLTLTSATTGVSSHVTFSTAAADSGLSLFTAGATTSGAATFNIGASNDKLSFKVDGGAAQTITLTTNVAQSAAGLVSDINTQLTNNGITGITASTSGGAIVLTNSAAGSNHSVQIVTGGSNDASGSLGYNGTAITGTDANVGFGFKGASFTGNTQGAAPTTSPDVLSAGAYQTAGISFAALANGSDSQTINVSATDTSGATHTTNVVLHNNTTSQTGASIDSTLNAINNALQQSNVAALQNVTAVKYNNAGTEQIKFVSANTQFSVTVGTTGSGAGLNGTGIQGSTVNAAVAGTGSTADISTQTGAGAAVNALATAVQILGTAQAAVGKGENNLNYAVALAQSQTTNEAAAESQIRDANLAQEAANLTRAQILVQAGTAALSQANSAPQQLLSLLQGH